MNIGVIGTNYCDFGLCTISDGLRQKGHQVYDMSGGGLNYMKPAPANGFDMDFILCADTDNLVCVNQPATVPKVILHVHDRWTDYRTAPNSPVKYINYDRWVCDIAFVRDYDGEGPKDRFPIYTMEFAIESRYIEACGVLPDVNSRQYDIAFFGTQETGGRTGMLQTLEREFKCDFGPQWKYDQPDEYWSKWVNGRYTHDVRYYQALRNAKMVFSPIGAGPSCGRTYEAYAAGAVPLIRRYPPEIQQIVPFVDHKNCILWSNTEELISKIKPYLEDPEKLGDLATRCYNFGTVYLTSRDRVAYMLEKMKQHGING